MTNKYLIVNDIHLKGVSPVHRIDKYPTAILAKAKEIAELSVELDVDSVICGGDIFESNIISTVLLDDFIDIIEGGKPWRIVPGNHDEIGNNWKTSAGTSLAHAIRRSNNISLFEQETQDDYEIVGYRYYHGIELDIAEDGLKVINKKKFNIAIVHGLLTEKRMLPQMMHIAVQDIDSDYDVVIVAHNHTQYSPMKVGNTTYIFNGCVGRRKINEASIVPSILFLDANKKECYPIELKSAKAGIDVFELDKANEEKEYNKEIDEFISNLENSKIEGVDLRGVIEHICKESKESNTVKDYLINKIGEYEND